jgi:DNA-binding transcriptional regulator YdaS (Cro superfamily)
MRHSRALAPGFHALVTEAVRILGSQAALAAELGKSQQLVSFLCTHATEISAEDAIGIHRATGGRVPASMLRPDLWRCPEHVPAEARQNRGFTATAGHPDP